MAINPLTGQVVPDIQQVGARFGTAVDPLTGAPPTGLIGSEAALTTGANDALAALRQARNLGVREFQQIGRQATGAIRGGEQRATGFLQQGLGGFDPFSQAGTQANDIQAALSGALGPEAQRQALGNLQPVNEFLQQQGELAVTRQASALGGLGGGNVQKELVRFGQGLAGTSAQQQFQNLGTLANRGLSSVTGAAGLRGQQANIAAQSGRDISSSLGRTNEGILNARLSSAQNIANLFGGTASQLSQGRTRAGEGIASAIGGTTSALADLVNQQGGNLANLLSGAGQTQGASQTQLATLLSNLAVQEGSTVAGLPGIPGVQQTQGALGGLGQLAGGIGGLLTGLGS